MARIDFPNDTSTYSSSFGSLIKSLIVTGFVVPEKERQLN